MQVWYVMIHVIKQDMDPNSNINYRRKIPPLPSTCAVYTTTFFWHLSRISRKFHFEVVWLTGLNMQTLRHTSLQSCKKKSWHAQFKRSHVLHDQPWMATAHGVCLVAQLRCLDCNRLVPNSCHRSCMVSYCYETELEIWAGFGSAWQFRVN